MPRLSPVDFDDVLHGSADVALLGEHPLGGIEQQLFGGLGGITGAPQFAGQRAAAHGSRPRDASFSWHVRLPFYLVRRVLAHTVV